ncbi:TetR/AcrR family transcriptional regulator [Catenuloplanes atrovinosus]|uniref:AcrR family transcriptional regulator n=1 Tax=Catenuloplanes atrovinosus TaxID=137266 RepID=A0AAE3YI39_9ACTN|nr:TetR/AcrR family transcriptional regulator [Catenuloplanes atrovinosus]MDR7273352.1 AcrR family transcriptional regulator [Catenuloplanes atrovinosus]
MSAAPTRRERVRTATVAEIKEVARRLLVGGGLSAVSLRAIGREVGMTAPALYRYFPGLDALVGALAADLFAELTEAVRAVRDDLAGEPPMVRLTGMARAFRRWSLAHPREFALMFGGVLEHCDSSGFAELFLAELTGFAPDAFLTAWSRVYGLVALEVFGHVQWATPDPEALFERELDLLAEVLRPR